MAPEKAPRAALASVPDLMPPAVLPDRSISHTKPLRTVPATDGGSRQRNTSTTAVQEMSPSGSHSSENTHAKAAEAYAAGVAPANVADASSAKPHAKSSKAKVATASFKLSRTPPVLQPPLPELDWVPKVEPAPPSGMYWSKAPTYDRGSIPLRAHTSSLVGSNIFVFGGCDSKACFNELYVFDADAMYWSKPECIGGKPPPLRAMTTTVVGKKLVIFGGGDGPTYYNEIYVLDTLGFRYSRPKVTGTLPSMRRAHTACLYKGGIYVFGGGDGVRALNDVWRLDVTDTNRMSWKLISPSSAAETKSEKNNGSGSDGLPTARGYHTANMVGSKLIIYGGSDGVECFRDVWIFDVETLIWKCAEIKVSYPRLSHTATIVGSYLFVIGGHDGQEYSSEVLLLNLVTMQWDRRKVYGIPPSGRGYHGTVLHDSRLFITGGFDGHTVFEDTYILELAVSAYYSQISHFSIDV